MTVQVWVTVIVGVVGFGGVIVTLSQKDRADRRAELWRRLTWAFERAVSMNAAASALGLSAVDIVSRSSLVSREEKEIASAFLDATLVSPRSDGDFE
ncbi:hypothetical protein [Tomitella fengzijianii]|uniref:Uncharacterized protein n=1 Tax=Tomitella fengzijianii TaxID=2597660 RepID=A0A516X0X3_9ACTN|nr:hypothetical protein [Tomitella fengzijianii]QDQ96718.1 hypothetical protein FO059_04380 [Tomitella fengzijianii]